jgi:hypothetical protein
MELVGSSEMLVAFHHITWRDISGESNLHIHRFENLKSRTKKDR